MKTISRYCGAFALLGCLALLGTDTVQASHWRGGYITYTPTGTPGQVEITAVWYSRRSYYGSPVVGSTFGDATLFLGDGTNAGSTWTVTAINATDDWLVAQKVVVKTYADPNAVYNVSYGTCCRLGGIGNRSSGSFDISARVIPSDPTAQTSSGPFVGVPRSTNTMYTIPVVPQDGDSYRCRFATTSEAGGGTGAPNMTLNANTCTITWNNQALPADFYTEQFIIEELDGQGNVKTTVPVDILFQIGAVNSVDNPPVCTIAPGTPQGGGVTEVPAVVGVPLAFTVTGTDPDQNQTITVSNTQLPAGATQSPDPASGPSPGPVVATVNYTPGSTGTFLATFSVSSGQLSTLCTARIVVVPASTPCTDPSTAPSYAGGYVLSPAGNRAFVKVMVPQGGLLFEFYNMTNLVVGDPEGAANDSPTPLAGVTRAGDSFLFAGPSPMEVFFPVTTMDPTNTRVAFFLRVTDTCQRVVDVDPSFTLTGVEATELTGFALGAAQPNPTATEATIRFSLERAGAVRLAVYDVLGREVALLVNEARPAGEHNARLEAGNLPAGVYLYRLEADGRSVQKMLTVAR